MEIIDNIPVWGAPVDEAALKQIKTCYYIFGQAAMMADHHKGYGVPIGGVIAHETLVSPSGVGYDIGCGNKAVLTDADRDDVRANIARIMDDVWTTISFGLARKNKEPVDHELFDDNNDDAWQITQGANSAAWKLTSLRDMARAQLGTVGSGNHYVDIFEDEHRPDLGRSALRLPRIRPQDRHALSEPRRRQRRHGLRPGGARLSDPGRVRTTLLP